MSEKYDALAVLLERFDWLADSLVHSISLDGSLRYDICATLMIRVIDDQDGLAGKTLKLVLSDVTEFKLAQMPDGAAFESSQGAGIARDGDRLFLDLGGPEMVTDAVPVNVEWKPSTPHLTVDEIRKRGFYLDFKDFTAAILPLAKIADGGFGVAKG